MAWRHDAVGVGRGSFIGPRALVVGGGKRETWPAATATAFCSSGQHAWAILLYSGSEEKFVSEFSQNARSMLAVST
jgi:hypothetical protein